MSCVLFSILPPLFERPLDSKTRAHTFDRNVLFMESVLHTQCVEVLPIHGIERKRGREHENEQITPCHTYM